MASEIEVLEDTTVSTSVAAATSTAPAAAAEGDGAAAAAEDESLKNDVYTAAAYGDLEKLERLVEGEGRPVNEPDSLGYHAIQWAALNNRVAAAQYILEHGADVNAVDHKGQTALHWSAVRGHIQVAELLLKKGAQVDAADLYGYQATHIAAQYDQTAFIDQIVAKWNADPDVPDNDGRSPLHWAAYKGFADSIRLLLFLDAYRGRQDKEGCTPLHWAAIRGNLEACTVLVQAGKKDDLMVKDKTGSTPAKLAADNNHQQVAFFLGNAKHEMVESIISILLDRSSRPQRVPLEYLRQITNDFSAKQLLGEGGFGKVYKGVLQDGQMIAVKKLNQLKPGVHDRKFENEVHHLIKLKHPNIVLFVGYCYESQNEYVEYNGKCIFAEIQQRLLCLEYLPNGSLDGHLSDESARLDWHACYKIIKGICCGLHYLHEECKCQINGSIIHLDLKPANILLDDNLVPKIADFGLSRLFDDKKTQTYATTLAGSQGYMAPEYVLQGKISPTADIYSFGVIIIEMITGCKFGPSGTETFCEDFVEPVLKKWRNRLEAVPTYTSLETDCRQVEFCLQIGISCTQYDPRKRPTAREIVEMLNKWESEHCNVSDDEMSRAK